MSKKKHSGRRLPISKDRSLFRKLQNELDAREKEMKKLGKQIDPQAL